MIDTVTTRLLVNDRSQSVFGAGVGVAGLTRLKLLSDSSSVLITDGDGSMYLYRWTGLPGSYYTPGGTTARLSLSGVIYRLTQLDSSYIEFNSARRMAKAVDRFGNQTTLGYGSGGADSLLRVIIDPMGKRDSLCYGASCGTTGKLTEIRSLTGAGSGIIGRTMTVLMDGTGRLIRFTDPDGKSDSLAYNAAGLLAGVYDRARNRTDFIYDALNRVDSIKAPSITLYDGTTGRPSTRTIAADRVAWQPSVAGTSTGTAKTGLWADTVRASLIDPLGATTRMTLDRFGAPLKITDPFGAVTTISRDTAGRVTRELHPTGKKIGYYYNGYALSEVHDSSVGGTARKVTFTYDPGNYNVQRVRGDVVPQDFMYYTSGSQRGALKEVWLGNTSGSPYPALQSAKLLETHKVDNLGRDTAVRDTLGHGTKYEYEATWGNLWKVTDGAGAVIEYKYNGRGLADTTVVPPMGKSWVTYGTMNQVPTEGRSIPGATNRLVASYA
jgi:YD repeat-containing protein